MTYVEAIAIAATGDDLPREKQVEAWQYLIDTGLCWRMSGWYARQAQHLINLGVCTAQQPMEKDNAAL